MECSAMQTLVALFCLFAVLVAAPLCSGARPLLNNDLAFRFNENRTSDVAKEESTKAGKVVYNILLKRGISDAFGAFCMLHRRCLSPSEPSPRQNAVVNSQRLSKSKHSPAVGHMENFNIAKSGETSGVIGIQSAGKKRILRSSPSPGAGH